MQGLHRRSWIGVLVGVALLMAALSAVAFGTVVVYKNQFANRGDVRELKKEGGKACERDFSREHKRLVVIAEKAPKNCPFRVPVAGDRPRPDHVITTDAKLSKDTPKALRRAAFVAVMLRVGREGGYELRVFPKRERFELRRSPNGSGFPAKGASPAIKGMGKSNKLRLHAVGSRITASVNGTELANVRDPRPGELDGVRVQLALGNRGDSPRKTKGGFDDLRVAVPDP